MRRWLQGLADLCFPAHCHFCGEPVHGPDHDFCRACLTSLAWDPSPPCPRCGSALPQTAPARDSCAECLGLRLPWDRVTRFGIYQGELRRAVLACKGRSGEGLARALGRLWARGDPGWSTTDPQAWLIPVPRHWLKTIWLNHNPAESLAMGLSEALGLRLKTRLLIRTRLTAKQSELPKSLRKSNVRWAFRCAEAVPPGTQAPPVILVDDIMTTGATALYAVKALRRAGYPRVAVAILARGKSRTNG